MTAQKRFKILITLKFTIPFFLMGLFFAFPTFVHAANRYWVGGTGNWDATTTHWSATSGGSAGATVPTNADNVFFNSASSGASYTVTISAAAACGDLNIAHPASGVITLAGSSTLNIRGSATFVSGMTRTYNGAITFSATTTGKTIATNGVALASNIFFNGGGGAWTLQTALVTTSAVAGTITLTNGTLNTNNQSVTSRFFTAAAGTKTLTLGSSTWTLTGSNATIWNWSTTTATMTANTATIVSNQGPSGTRTFTMGLEANNPNLSISAGTDTVIISAAYLKNLDLTGFAGTWSAASGALSLYGNLTLSAGMVRSYTAALTFAATSAKTITSNGKALASAVTFNGVGGSWQLQDAFATTGAVTLTNGTLNTNNQSISSLTFATAVGTKTLTLGSSTWTLTGSNATIWNWSVTNATMSVNTATIVSNYAGATGTRTFTMGLEANNPSLSISAGIDTVIISAAYLKNLDFTGFAGTWSAASGALSLYGNLTLSTGMTSAYTDALTFAATTGGKTVTSNGKTLASAVTFNGVGGSWTLQDAFSTTGAVTLTNGTLDDNNKNVFASNFSASNSNSRGLVKGSGTWTLSGIGIVWDVTTSTNFNLTDTGTIKFSNNSTSAKIFAGGGKTYNNFWNTTGGTGTLTVGGSNTFNNFRSDAGRTNLFTAGTTQTANSFSIVGAPSNSITLGSTSTTPFNLVKTGGGKVSADYLSISYSNVTPADTWYAGTNSVDNGNNSGWSFSTLSNQKTIRGTVKTRGTVQVK